MSLPINPPNPTQPTLSFSSVITPETLDTYTTSNYVSNISNILDNKINTKQNILTAATNLLGIGSSITLINYNTLSNLPSTFPPTMTNLYNRTEIDNISNANSNYTRITSNILSNLIITKQNTLTASTILSGIGSNLTLVNYNTLSNLPSTFTPTMTNLYNKTEIDSITSNLYSTDFYERQYPPKAYDTVSGETTATGELTNILPTTFYKQTITLNNTGITYGSGTYIIYSSTTYGSLEKQLLFNFNFNDPAGAAYALSQYSVPSGTYLGSNYIVSGYTGDWIVIKLPVSIILTKFVFKDRPALTSRAPAEWKCYGSNDGNTFTEITEASQLTRLTASDYSGGIYTKQLNRSFQTNYLYIGFTFNKNVGGANSDMINFNEIQLFGKEQLILPFYISSNVFNSTLTNYSTTGNDTNYLLKTGGTMTGDLTISRTGARLSLKGTGTTGAISRLDLSAYDFTTYEPTCSIITTDDGNYSSSFDIRLKTAGALANTQTSALFIKSDRNVGIGTTDPNVYKLNVNGSLNATTIWQNGTELNTLLNAKQNTLTASTTLLGVGSSITELDYNKITLNVPSTFPPIMTNIYTKTETNTLLDAKQNTLTAATTLLGVGSSITELDYNKITLNVPSTFPPTMTNIYTKTETNTLLDAKQNTLTAATTLLGIGSNITLINYNTLSNLPLIYTRTESDDRYLRLTGGTMSGAISGITTTTTNKLNCVDNAIPSALNVRNLNLIGDAAVMRIWRNHATNNPSLEFLSGPTTSTSSYDWWWDMFIGAGSGNNFFAIRDRKPVSLPIRFIIDTNGNTGIGTTTNASYRLNVEGAFNSTSLWQNGTQIDFSSYLLKSGGVMTGDLTISRTGARLSLKGGGGGGATSRLDLSAYDFTTNEPTCSIITTDDGNFSSSFDIRLKTPGALANPQSSALFIKSNRNVGINTNNPICQLDINGIANIHNGAGYAARNNHMQIGSLTIGSSNLNYGGGNNWNANTAGLMLECLNNTEIAVHDAGERIASLMYYSGNTITIGRNMGWNEISLVDIKSGLTILGQLTNQFWRLTNQSDWLRVYTASGDNYFNFAANYLFAAQGLTTNNECYFNITGFGTIMQITSSGVRIPSSGFSIVEWYLSQSTSPTNVLKSFVFHHSATGVNSKWWFNGAQTNTNSEISDERIKKEINDIQTPLNKIMELKPKEYYLCDDKDYNKKFGIIAQDVEKVFPEFIHTEKDYVANIYSYATYDNKDTNYIITLDKDITELINIDDELKIILDNNDKNNLEIVIDDTPYNNRYKRRFVKVVEIIDNHSFKIDIDLEINEIFIYGKKVDDFKRLDYESLYCLNIAATQELYKIIQSQQQQIEELKSLILATLQN